MKPVERPASSRLTRRQALRSGSLVLLLGTAQLARGASIVAVRVWPATEYTRVTIESDTALQTQTLFVANPITTTVWCWTSTPRKWPTLWKP